MAIGPSASNNSAVTPSLVLGAALFGIGWGLAGVCPGPGIVSLGAGKAFATWLVPAVLVGVAVTDRVRAAL